jgi:hypothetical protein
MKRVDMAFLLFLLPLAMCTHYRTRSALRTDRLVTFRRQPMNGGLPARCPPVALLAA